MNTYSSEGATCGQHGAGPLAGVGWVGYRLILEKGTCQKQQSLVSHTAKIYKIENSDRANHRKRKGDPRGM